MRRRVNGAETPQPRSANLFLLRPQRTIRRASQSLSHLRRSCRLWHKAVKWRMWSRCVSSFFRLKTSWRAKRLTTCNFRKRSPTSSLKSLLKTKNLASSMPNLKIRNLRTKSYKRRLRSLGSALSRWWLTTRNWGHSFKTKTHRSACPSITRNYRSSNRRTSSSARNLSRWTRKHASTTNGYRS